jgi:hypothetical protein
MVQQLTAQMLRHQAGRQMRCAICDDILDWNNAVSVDVVRSERDELVTTTMTCGPCFDAWYHGDDQSLDPIRAKAGGPVTVKITDGRDYTEEGDYQPVPPIRVGGVVEYCIATREGAVRVQGQWVANGDCPWRRPIAMHRSETGRYVLTDVCTGHRLAIGDAPQRAYQIMWRKVQSWPEARIAEVLNKTPVLQANAHLV